MTLLFTAFFPMRHAKPWARTCRRILCLLLAIAWSSVASAHSEQVTPELVSSHGYVLVYFPKGLGLLEVRPAGGGSTVKLRPRDGADGRAYGAWLPPGEYHLSNWNSYLWGDYASFRVEAGRITDLGSLVPFNIGGYQEVVLPLRVEENAGAVDEALKQYGPLLKSKEPILWTPVSVPRPIQLMQPPTGLGLVADLLEAHDRKVNKPSTIAQLKSATSAEVFLRLFRDVTKPLYVHPAQDPNGNFYFGADLGQIRVRHADGSWSGIGIDTLHSISAVAYVDGVLYAGSDNGVLRSSADGGKSWRDIKSFGEDEAIIDIEHEDTTWIVATAHQVLLGTGGTTADGMTVYLSQQGGPGTLEKSREFPLEKKLLAWFGAMGQLVHGSYYINTHDALYRYDLASRQWKTITPPSTISGHHVDPTTDVVSVFFSKGMFSKVFVSIDKGDTWKQVKRPPYAIADVQFDTPTKGYAIRADSGAFKVTWEIYSYDPGTGDWVQGVSAPALCVPQRVAVSIPVYCIASDGSILGNRGKDWDVEFSAQ